jgi:histidinol phosphatase-like enzyme (inositol monophosphatase family)
VDVVRQAGEFTMTHFRAAELEIIRKADGSPVTMADQGAEDLMRKLISARFPDDAILGEEGGDTPGTSGRRWVIDPIDGTEAFTHGVALYSNLLYLEDADGPAIGVINIPAIGEMCWAGRGLGCFLNGIPCSVSTKTDLAGSVLSTSGFDYWDEGMLANARRSGMQMRTWGDGYGYLLVASGRIEVMVDPAINFWDIAPCLVIIPEAGGMLSTAAGEIDVELTSCIATNGLVHDQVIAALNA